MTIHTWLDKSINKLESAGLATPILDTEILLADYLNRDRSWLHAHDDHILQRSDLRILNEQIARRANHEPIAYIRGMQEFYGREFSISPATLTPRPETETMVELALDILNKENIRSVADVGSGSGCIIITLQLESDSKATFTGYEISEEALVIAKENAHTLDSSAIFKKCDITNSTNGWTEAQLIVANLPYVPNDFKINTAATHEPDIAIFGGKDGLDYYRVLFKQLSSDTIYVITESLPPQHKDLQTIAENNHYSLIETRDLIQLFKRI